MDWFKLHHDLPRHPKSEALGNLLGDPRGWTYVVELWCYASQFRASGDLSRDSDEIIARRSGWPADARLFVAALEQSGFLRDGILHDWDKTQGPGRKKSIRDAARKRKRRASGALPARGQSASGAPTARVDQKRSDQIRSEEKRSEEKEGTGEKESGVQATPEPPKREVEIKPKRNKPSHATLEAVLTDTHKPSGKTHLAYWRGMFPHLGKDMAPTIEEELRGAWDHQARKKRSDMPAYCQTWLRRTAQQWRPREQRGAAAEIIPTVGRSAVLMATDAYLDTTRRWIALGEQERAAKPKPKPMPPTPSPQPENAPTIDELDVRRRRMAIDPAYAALVAKHRPSTGGAA